MVLKDKSVEFKENGENCHFSLFPTKILAHFQTDFITNKSTSFIKIIIFPYLKVLYILKKMVLQKRNGERGTHEFSQKWNAVPKIVPAWKMELVPVLRSNKRSAFQERVPFGTRSCPPLIVSYFCLMGLAKAWFNRSFALL